MDRRRTTLEIAVDPGNCEIERGTPLIVVAEFPKGVPSEAKLVFTAADAPKKCRRVMFCSSLNGSGCDMLCLVAKTIFCPQMDAD